MLTVSSEKCCSLASRRLSAFNQKERKQKDCVSVRKIHTKTLAQNTSNGEDSFVAKSNSYYYWKADKIVHKVTLNNMYFVMWYAYTLCICVYGWLMAKKVICCYEWTVPFWNSIQNLKMLYWLDEGKKTTVNLSFRCNLPQSSLNY